MGTRWPDSLGTIHETIHHTVFSEVLSSSSVVLLAIILSLTITLHGISCNVGFPESLEDGVAQGNFSNRSASSIVYMICHVPRQLATWDFLA